MQINRVSNCNTNFTSKVYITNYSRNEYYIQDFYKTPEFEKSVKELENNGKDNEVVIFNSAGTRIYMTVRDDKNVSFDKTIYNPYNPYGKAKDGKSIKEAYKACLFDLKCWSANSSDIPAELDKYILS